MAIPEQISFVQLSSESASWQLMTHFVLRSPGFPFSWLAQLSFPDTIDTTQHYREICAHQQMLQETFAEEIFPSLIDEETAVGQDKSVFRFWYKLAKRIRQGQTVSADTITQVQQHGRFQLVDWLQKWQDTCQQQQKLHEEGKRTFQNELALRRHTLYQLVQDDHFQEALWLSNPSIYETGWRHFRQHGQAQRRPAKIKHLERRFYTYLQRFCAKNDTTSFFGPLNYGRFQYNGTQADYQWAEQPIRQRHIFFAYWAVQAIADLIASTAEIRPYLRPRRNPLRQRGSTDDHAARLYHLSHGQQTITELAQTLNQSPTELLAAIEQLEKDNWIHLDLPIPPSELDPLQYLIRQLEVLPADCLSRQHWLTILNDLQQTGMHYTNADLPQRQMILNNLETEYTNLIGIDSRRGQGKMFQDRTLLYEECLGGLQDFHLSRVQHQHITHSLVSIANITATYAHYVRSDLQAIGRHLFDQISPEQKPIPFTYFITAWRKQYPHLPPLPTANQLQQQLTELVDQRQAEKRSVLTAADIQPLCQLPDEPITFSPDLLLAAPDLQAIRDNNYQLVLGEIHHGVQPVGWMLTFADDLAEWHHQINQHLPQSTATTTPTNLLFGRRMKTAPPEFAGPSVQVSAVSTQSQALQLSDLIVEPYQDTSLRLRAPHHAPFLAFYPPVYYVPESLYAPFICFSYLLLQNIPIQLGQHTPRIEIEGTIYQREQWQFATEDLPGLQHTGTTYQLMVDYLQFRSRWQLPQHVFIKSDQEPKPIYIDFHNYFALELLVHVASQTDIITFVEMCPAPEQLWLQKGENQYTCELRTVLSTNKV